MDQLEDTKRSADQSNTSQLMDSRLEGPHMSFNQFNTSQLILIDYIDLTDHLVSFIPVITCVFISFGYGVGLGPIPYILFGELFPSK